MAETSPVGYLDRLFEHFEAAYNQQDGGWGQFLNGAPQHPQVGLYGTAAGGIVYGAADRVSTPAATAALQTLRSWWSSGDQRAQRYRVQNIRVAMLLLGLGLLTPQQELPEITAIRDALSQRLLPGIGLWGEYWVSANQKSETPSLFVSSIVLIAVRLARRNLPPTDAFVRAAEALRDRYLADPRRHAAYAKAIHVACSMYLAPRSRKKLRPFSRDAAADEIDLTGRYNHFYDYVDEQGIKQRDYFILPLEILLPLCAWSEKPPVFLYFKARNVSNAIKAILDKNHGEFKTATERTSSIEQGFVALALLGEREKGQASRGAAWLLYEATKKRRSLERFGSILECVAFALLGVCFLLGAFDKESGGYGEWLPTGIGVVLAAIKDPRAAVATALRGSR